MASWNESHTRRDTDAARLPHPAQIVGDIVRAVGSVVGRLCQALPHQAVERGGRKRLERGDGCRFTLQDRAHQADDARALERPLPRDHLVDDGAQRPEVRPRIRRPPLQLLRRHVLKGADDHALPRQARGLRGHRRHHLHRRRLVPVPGQLRQPEVEQLRAALRQHDVPGLQVPVDHALPVRGAQGVRDLRGDRQRLLQRQRPFLQALRERLPGEVLHHEEHLALVIADVVERADVRVVQAGDGLRLALEASAAFGVGTEFGQQNLDRDRAVEPRVAGLVDLAHPA